MDSPPQSRIASWVQGLHADHMSDGMPKFGGIEPDLSYLNEPAIIKDIEASLWFPYTDEREF